MSRGTLRVNSLAKLDYILDIQGDGEEGGGNVQNFVVKRRIIIEVLAENPFESWPFAKFLVFVYNLYL